MFTKIVRLPVTLVKYASIGLLVLFGSILSLPYLFPGYVSNQIKTWANGHIQTELSFTKARLSFFEHFPSLTLTLHDFSLKGAAPFQKDTLVAAEKVSLGVNLLSLFGRSVDISEIYLSNGRINVLVNEAGEPNYNVYTASASTDGEKAGADTSNASLRLQKIQIDDCELLYHDASIPFRITASQLAYQGKGDLHKMVFDLKSRLAMENLSLWYNNENYLLNKQLKARLTTKVNTGSLQLLFEKTNLRINALPVTFKGRFDFLENGYDLDFDIATRKAAFKDLFTALPPSALQWLNRTTVKGDVELAAQLKGKYAVAENAAPDLAFSMRVANGSIASNGTKAPVENIQLKLSGSLPGLSPERLHLAIDTIHASLGQQFLAGSLELKGLSKPFVKGTMAAAADVAVWNKTLGTDSLADLRGLLELKASFNGRYDRAAGTLPAMFANLAYRNGYIKTPYYPNPVSDIQVAVVIKNETGRYRDLSFSTTPIAFTFEGKPFTVTSEISNLDNPVYKIRSKGVIDIGRIYQVFAVDGYDVDGSIATDLHLQGSQEAVLAKRFDQLQQSGTFALHRISIRSRDFPKPLTIDEGLFRVKNDRVIAEKIACRYGSIRAQMNGHLSNVFNYLLLDGAPLQGRLAVQADAINLGELAPTATVATAEAKEPIPASAATGVVPVPTNLDLVLAARVGKIDYNGLQLSNCRSVVAVKGGSLHIDTAAFEMIGAPVNFRGSYRPDGANKARFTAAITADEFDIARAHKEITLFSEMAPSAANVNGVVSLRYQLSGRLNDQMQPVLPSLKGGGVLTLKKVKLKGFKLLSAIKKQTGKNLDDSPDLSKIELKTTVANNIMTIERTKLKVAGFRPRFEGQASLDGKLNIQCRLGLPPFGIIGIPLSITGTQDKPVVKLRRGKKSDALQETEDDADEEDRAEAAAAGNE